MLHGVELNANVPAVNSNLFDGFNSILCFSLNLAISSCLDSATYTFYHEYSRVLFNRQLNILGSESSQSDQRELNYFLLL